MARTTKDDQPGGRVSSEALDEERHGDDEADSHKEHSVPVGLGGGRLGSNWSVHYSVTLDISFRRSIIQKLQSIS